MMLSNSKRLLVSFLFCLISLSANAFIGGNINEFKNYFQQSFDLTSSSKSNGVIHYYFSCKRAIRSDPKFNGFDSAMTISVKNAQIIGESMIIEIGKNHDDGILLATTFLANIVIEATQRKITSQKTFNAQMDIYKNAITKALSDNPQILDFPKDKIKVKIKQIDFSKLLVTITR